GLGGAPGGAGAGAPGPPPPRAAPRGGPPARRAAGGGHDRGIVVLVDPRFTESRCQAFFPGHWRPERVRAAALGDAVAAFWGDPDGVAPGGPSSPARSAVVR
ncbi:MAG: hypothetical protein OXM56_09915, partial [Gammaproteobacteria bacterium]|nr:hypothetical protein [Gammaproteobacteria bacterium]